MWRRALRSALWLGWFAFGCSRSGVPIDQFASGDEPSTGARAPVPAEENQARADKIDLLFVIDDSGSMRDKQQILSRALPDLVDRLTNPLCLDPVTLEPAAQQPTSALANCPGGTLREFNSVQDLHIGVVSSSLGGVGASSCGLGIGPRSARDFKGHLIAPQGADANGRKFLVWDSRASGARDPAALRRSISDLVVLGENGCPYEMPLEAMYRFLIDPDPYAEVQLAECGTDSAPEACAVQDGVDTELLREREAFLRYDSLVAIILLTDENDCSLRAGGQSFRLFDERGSVPRATDSCAANPSDRCCRSCADPAPPGCSDDAGCARGPYAREEDSGLLRCYQSKRRLGRDYLYPVSRYVEGLRSGRVPNRSGVLVPNPLFVDPSGKQPPRDPSLVFIAAVVGVPWQDLAVDPSDDRQLELKTRTQMDADGTWDLILGDPERGVPPRDPLMVESTEARAGVHPILGTPLAPPSAASPRANPINGHETELGDAPIELQTACIFDLPMPVESSTDCRASSGLSRAICQAEDGTYGSTQYRAKAFPGVRELQVLKNLGTNAIPASICVRNLQDETRSDYGYRPVLRLILDRLRVGLN